jgi:hypothetical protein
MATFPFLRDCERTEPFIKLEPEGVAPIINYNLPAENWFKSTTYLLLDINNSCFKPTANAAPENNFWDLVENLSPTQLAELINDDIAGFSDRPVFVNGNQLQALPIVHQVPKATAATIKGSASDSINTIRQLKGSVRVQQNQPMELEDTSDYYIAGLRASEIIKQITKGRRPMLNLNFAGISKIKFVARPVSPRPRIAIALHYKTLLFPLNYGMGKIVKTFSLLPGEVTTFNLRSYRHNEETKTRSETIFDSCSQSFAQAFENQVQTQNMNASQNAFGADFAVSTGIEVGGGIAGIIGVGGGSTINFGTNVDTASQNQYNSLQSVINTTTSEANFNRDLTVNTDVSSFTMSGTEETTTREIRNENRSRTLNFVFRQLMQEYMAVTYLDDVSIHYSNGYPESYRTARLDNINDLLTAVLQDAAAPPCDDIINKVREEICFQLCNIFDYLGEKKSFIVCEEQTLTDCCGGREPVTKKIIRKNPAIEYTIEGRKINGIVIGVNKYVVKTDGVIVDALLGGGEALDCYNHSMQNIAIMGGQMDIQASIQRLEIAQKIIDSGTNEEVINLIKNYNNMHGSCCATPQSTNGCGCTDCIERTRPTPETPE